MTSTPQFKSAFPYQKDLLALPVKDLDAASEWYGRHFGMREVERRETPLPAVILERDDVKLGFEVNGGDAAQDGAGVLVLNIKGMQAELEAKGVKTGNSRVDKWDDGREFHVFFVVAPDGLCFYFHEPVSR